LWNKTSIGNQNRCFAIDADKEAVNTFFINKPNKIPKVNTIKIRLPKVNGICTIFIHQVIYLQIITVQNTEELILILHTICDFDS
jgi:hypothetical protein